MPLLDDVKPAAAAAAAAEVVAAAAGTGAGAATSTGGEVGRGGEEEEVQPFKLYSCTDLSPDLQRLQQSFQGIADDTFDLTMIIEEHLYDDDEDEEVNEMIDTAYENLFHRIQDEIADQPVLARTVASIDGCLCTLLEQFCMTISGNIRCLPALKFLIEENPYALIWEVDDHGGRPIRFISSRPCCHVLMPWVAENFGFILDHPVLKKDPPHLIFVENCYDASIIREFYELYPRGLSQKNQEIGYPLHAYIKSRVRQEDIDPDLVEWMAKQHPESMMYRSRAGATPLFRACMMLVYHRPTENMAEVCCFLATECPESVPIPTHQGFLPIHVIAARSNRPAIQKVLLALLREYPQSIAVVTGQIPTLNKFPFIQKVAPVLQKEREIKEEITSLKEASAAWCEAMRCSKDPLQVSALDIFTKWANLRKVDFQHCLEETIPQQIAEIGLACEGEKN